MVSTWAAIPAGDADEFVAIGKHRVERLHQRLDVDLGLRLAGRQRHAEPKFEGVEIVNTPGQRSVAQLRLTLCLFRRQNDPAGKPAARLEHAGDLAHARQRLLREGLADQAQVADAIGE